MLQDLVDSLEQEQQSMEEALNSSPIASQLLDFSLDNAGLFSEALLATSDNLSASDPAADPSVYDASIISAAFSMDPAALSCLLDPQPSTPDPNELIQAINVSNSSYPEAVLPQQDQFDQMVTDGFSTAYSIGAMLPRPVYEQDCLMPDGLTSYAGMEPVSANSCSFMDPGIGGMMYQERMDVFPTMVGPMELGIGLQEVAEYQNRAAAAVAMGGRYGMKPLQHVYSTSPAELQVFGDRQQQQQLMHTCGSPTPVMDMPSLDDSTFKVGRISAEERKEKIHRYMKKRNERNFSKKIKYACRKTLADSRPRVRGRFAKNKESEENASEENARASSSHIEYDDDEEMMVKEEDLFNPSDIFAHISGVNSFKYNYTVESWI